MASLLLAGLIGLGAHAAAVRGQPAADRPSTQPAAAQPVAGRPSTQAGVLSGPGEQLRRLCAAWQPEGRPPLVEAPFRAPPLRYEGGRLVLELAQAATVEDGVRGLVEILPAEAEQAAAPMGLTEGARLMRAQAAGELEARMGFYPERGRLLPTPCLSLGGGRVLRVRVQPLWVGLWLEGKEQVRLYTEQGEVLAPQGQPVAQVDVRGLVFDGDGHDLEVLRAALPALAPRAGACYQQALGRRADLAGVVVLGGDVDPGGRLLGARIEVDGVGEAELARCLREVWAALRLPRLRRGGHLSVPLMLRRVVNR
ncbi:MAG: hypothetical protein NZ890_02330 [Myxococcota bacterium]|nr:hypothetical protein [Myxococcota bacterium]